MGRNAMGFIRRISSVGLCLLLLVSPVSRVLALQGRGAATPMELALILNESLIERRPHIIERYAGPISELFDYLPQLIPLAIGRDDYLRFNLEAWSISASGYSGDVRVEVWAKYLTTADEEAQLHTSLLQALPLVLKGTTTEESKIQAIHDAVCERLAYDETLKYYSAFAGWMDGKTVCQGYALLLQRMFDMAGIPSRILSGQLNGDAHAWNLVLVGGQWLHLDATNNDASQTKRFYLVGDDVMAVEGFVFDAAARARIVGDGVDKARRNHLPPTEACWRLMSFAGSRVNLRENTSFHASGGFSRAQEFGHFFWIQAVATSVFPKERKRKQHFL